MMRLAALIALLLLIPFTAHAAETPSVAPADCILANAQGAVASVEYGGKTYHFRDASCKEEFLTDPERFSQLYDTLLELKAQGGPITPPKPSDSAVPS